MRATCMHLYLKSAIVVIENRFHNCVGELEKLFVGKGTIKTVMRDINNVECIYSHDFLKSYYSIG